VHHACSTVDTGTYLLSIATCLQALKGVMTKLADVGQSASIVDVVYKYMELQEGKAGDSATVVEMTIASEESAAEIENKKNMLCALISCF
jgi:hypothetical protein